MHKLCVLTVLSVLCFAESSRILCVFPFPSVSHQVVFRTLTDELAQKGHELVIVTADLGYTKDNQTNIKEISMHDLTYSVWKKEMRGFIKNTIEDPKSENLQEISQVVHNIFTKQFKIEELQKIIKEEDDKFDLLILEAGFHSTFVLTHFIKAPVVLLSSFGSIYNNDATGVPNNEFLYPTQFRQKIAGASFMEEIYDVFKVKKYEHFVKGFKKTQNEWFKSVIGYEVSMDELKENIDLLLLNHFPLWEGIRPTPKNVVHLGGLHTKIGEELPEDLQEICDSSKNGVIYVSFGTIIASGLMPPEKVSVLVNVLSQLPYDVLFKWDKGELPGKGPNIVTSDWFPQADLLRHPKMKLFITQGGLQSTDEAIAAGVPLIGIPFLFDQFFNAENYVRHKIGLHLDITTLTEDILKDAIEKVITDKGYRENVFELRALMRDKSLNSLNQAVAWIDYVLRHKGAKHLRAPSANMHWTTYMELELVSIVLFVFLMMLTVILLLCKCICKRTCKSYRDHTRRRRMLFPR
nr:uridine diphosphate-glycosyltransferases 33AR1 [Glyphodes pyloalis]